MHVPINVKSPNNTSKLQMGFNSAFKGLKRKYCCSHIKLRFWKSVRNTGSYPRAYLIMLNATRVGRDGSVGIANHYRLRGSNMGGGEIFCPIYTCPRASYTLGTRSFPRIKVADAWRWPPTPSSSEVKEIVELYLYLPSGLSWPVLWWTLLYLYLYL
jgi:hypothetical protein